VGRTASGRHKRLSTKKKGGLSTALA
jgi:hypothetical protein